MHWLHELWGITFPYTKIDQLLFKVKSISIGIGNTGPVFTWYRINTETPTPCKMIMTFLTVGVGAELWVGVHHVLADRISGVCAPLTIPSQLQFHSSDSKIKTRSTGVECFILKAHKWAASIDKAHTQEKHVCLLARRHVFLQVNNAMDTSEEVLHGSPMIHGKEQTRTRIEKSGVCFSIILAFWYLAKNKRNITLYR